MTILTQASPQSAKRQILCSRRHAHRIAGHLLDATGEPVSLVRTGDPLQPFRVMRGDVASGTVELEMRSA